MFRSEIVSAWSMNQCSPLSGTSRFTSSYTLRWPGIDHSRPVLEISKLCFWLLREQIVGDADRQLAILMELINYLIVFRVVLKTAACVDNTRNAKPVLLAHEMAGRIRL